MKAGSPEEGPGRIDFRAKGEGREYLKKLAIPAIIVVLLLAVLACALWSSGTAVLAARLIASSLFVAGMLVGAIATIILLRAYMRMRFYFHVISYSVKASEHTLPEIFGIAKAAAGRLGVLAPGVYVVQDPGVNAYAIGLRRKIIAINTGLIDAMDSDELAFIVGHELSHVKYGWTIPVDVLGITVPVPLLFSSQRREYTCDRGGLIACGDLDKAVLALVKLALGKSLAGRVDVEKLYTTEDEVEKDRISKVSETLASHPPIKDRVLQLREFYGSGLYRRLVDTMGTMGTTDTMASCQ